MDLSELLKLILSAEKSCNVYEALIPKIEDSMFFKDRILPKMIEILPILCDSDIEITEIGFKSFINLYEKTLLNQPEESFQANQQALKRATDYVSKNRNKNYHLLRHRYGIDDLVLEPSLFSKDYYRLVHPNVVEEEVKPPQNSEPTGAVNNTMWLEQVTPHSYR